MKTILISTVSMSYQNAFLSNSLENASALDIYSIKSNSRKRSYVTKN